MEVDKKIEDDAEAMLLVIKLMQRGYTASDIRKYVNQVEHGSRLEPERAWNDPRQPRWKTL